MQNKVVIITGASDGIGLAAARILKQKGATVVIVGRSAEKTTATAAELNVPYYICDFTKLHAVRKLAKELAGTYPTIDVLVNNAGGVFGKRELTEDGYEKTFQVNHLAHFLLTNMLIKNLKAAKAIVINTSSIANQVFAKLDINDLNMEKNYSPNAAYGNAKLENILFTKELDTRYGKSGIAAVAFHPGNVATSFAHDSSGFLHFMYQSPLKRFARLITPETGADTLVWLATSKPGKDWQPGEYYYKRAIEKTNKVVDDPIIARSLWEQSEKMVEL